jgi:DNA mismatch repair protein MutS2
MTKKKSNEAADLQYLQMGSHVYVTRIKKHGIVIELMSKNRYRVSLGSLVITCSAPELTVSTTNQSLISRSNKIELPKITPPATVLDLHGVTVDEALRQLELWIDRVTLTDLSKVKVIHGLGSGKVQKAVHQYLTGLKSVVSFNINPYNPGETEIVL